MTEERAFKIAIVVIGHLMWLSTAAIRTIRGGRAFGSGGGGRFVRLYQYLVWIPVVLATFFASGQLDLPREWKLAAVAVALIGSASATWALWMRPSARYPGIVTYHAGAAVALESAALMLATALIVLPYTLLRVRSERDPGARRTALGV